MKTGTIFQIITQKLCDEAPGRNPEVCIAHTNDTDTVPRTVTTNKPNGFPTSSHQNSLIQKVNASVWQNQDHMLTPMLEGSLRNVLASVAGYMDFPRWLSGKESSCQCRRDGFDPWVREDPLKKEMATHSSTVAQEIPLTEESGELQYMGSQNSRTRLRDESTTTMINQ